MAGNICQKCFMKTMLIAFNPPMFTLSPSLILTKVQKYIFKLRVKQSKFHSQKTARIETLEWSTKTKSYWRKTRVNERCGCPDYFKFSQVKLTYALATFTIISKRGRGRTWKIRIYSQRAKKKKKRKERKDYDMRSFGREFYCWLHLVLSE